MAVPQEKELAPCDAGEVLRRGANDFLLALGFETECLCKYAFPQSVVCGEESPAAADLAEEKEIEEVV